MPKESTCLTCGAPYSVSKDDSGECKSCRSNTDPLEDFNEIGFDDVKLDPGQIGARFIERMRVKE